MHSSDLHTYTNKLVEIITKATHIEKIILFGSGARGERVSDKYIEDGITYEYESDIDLCVIVATAKLSNDTALWADVRGQLRAALPSNISVNLIVETSLNVKRLLSEGNYFYLDVFRDGKALYDTGTFVYEQPAAMHIAMRKDLAKREYDFWLSKAEDFLRDYNHNISDKSYNNAAFHLSQAVESLYFTVLLTFTGYKPKSHNLEKIEELVASFLPDIKSIFPRKTAYDIKLFDLLSRAYIDARYKKDYEVSLDELTLLYRLTLSLRDFVIKACNDKLSKFS